MVSMDDKQQYQGWLAQINQVCGSFDARQLEGVFAGELESGYTGNLKLSTVTAANVNLFRTPEGIKRSNDDWFYTVFQLDGRAVIEQGQSQIVLEAGDITLIDASRPCSIYWQQISRQISLLLPRQMLEQQARFQNIGGLQRLAHNLPMVQICHRLLQDVMTNPSLSETENEAALEAMVSLLRPVLQRKDEAPTRREQQFRKVIALIDGAIQSESLCPEWIAGESGMSVRSLYRMFADKGLVVAQYIKNRRLDLCAQALRSARDDEKLADIGYHWGFTDHSHFSTAFKQRFGFPPGEYRRRYR